MGMRIAQIAPLAESVPPKLYGGTERVVSYLTEELVALGHDVTLFASADSVTRAQLVSCAPRAQRLDPGVKEPLAALALMLERVRQRAQQFDVLHFHLEGLHFPLFRGMARKTVTTLHGRLDLPELAPLFKEFSDMPLIAISDSQRSALPRMNWLGTVHHGLPAEVCPLNPVAPRGAGRYLAFLGRVSPEKGLDRAIRIAQHAGMRLRIAAKVDAEDEHYWRECIVPQLRGSLVDFVGEVGEDGKPGFLGNAGALLFPIDWPEPFGLAMIEAMSCGTPVIGWRRGSVPEIIDHGLTGFVVDSIEEAAAAVPAALRLDRTRVRERFEQRFSARRMARDYLAVYRALGRRQAAVAAL
jgi:glycosyltransferase involved in cell wall biosynthesis